MIVFAPGLGTGLVWKDRKIPDDHACWSCTSSSLYSEAGQRSGISVCSRQNILWVEFDCERQTQEKAGPTHVRVGARKRFPCRCETKADTYPHTRKCERKSATQVPAPRTGICEGQIDRPGPAHLLVCMCDRQNGSIGPAHLRVRARDKTDVSARPTAYVPVRETKRRYRPGPPTCRRERQNGRIGPAHLRAHLRARARDKTGVSARPTYVHVRETKRTYRPGPPTCRREGTSERQSRPMYTQVR